MKMEISDSVPLVFGPKCWPVTHVSCGVSLVTFSMLFLCDVTRLAEIPWLEELAIKSNDLQCVVFHAPSFD